MLKCRDIIHEADAFLDGDLPKMRRLTILIHASVCKGCSRFLDQVRLTRALTQGALAKEPVALQDQEKIDALLAAFHGQQNPGEKSPAQEGCGNV